MVVADLSPVPAQAIQPQLRMRDVLESVRRVDPRFFQIGALGGLLCYGLFGLDFEVSPAQVVVTIGTALLAQLAFTRLYKLRQFDAKSALISSLSLCLLLRTNMLPWAAAASLIAIGSKFLLRVNGKHILNPTNGAIVLLLLSGAPVWVSPGQWGSVAFFAFLMASIGCTVAARATRIDVSLAFLVAWCTLVIGRSVWLGEPLTIPTHRLESGALLLFTFFMISDPKTTPNARAARVVFGVAVAVFAWWIQFRWFRTNGLLWSLSLFSLCVPVLDRVLAGPRHVWGSPLAGDQGADGGARSSAAASAA